MDFDIISTSKISLKEIIDKYEHFTFPNIRKKAINVGLLDPLLSVIARRNDKIAGMVIAEFNKHKPAAEIVSLYIDPQYRNKGLASRLLKLTEENLAKSGYKRARMILWSNWNSFELGKRLLNKNGWSHLFEIMIIVRATIDSSAELNWELTDDVLINQYEILPWVNISSQLKKELATDQERNNIFPPYLSPFQKENKIEKQCSLGVVMKGIIIGWNICYRQNRDTVEYNNLFIREEYRKSGLAQHLILKSVKLQRENNIPNIIGVFDVENVPVYEWYSKKMEKFLTSSTKIYQSYKDL